MTHEDETRDRPHPSPAPQAAPADPLAERVTQLEAELAAAKEEAKQNFDRWVRERADLENHRKRSARERQEAARFGNETIIRDLLPVADNLERALQAAGGEGAGTPLAQGVLLVLKSLLDVFQRHGVERVGAEGRPFDPTHHEAVAHVETETHPAGHVLEEHQRGYRLHDRLLRPALVSVSKAKSGAGKLANDGGGD